MEHKIKNRDGIGVYIIKSKRDNKIYVGGTENSFWNRYRGHINNLNSKCHSCVHLRNAYYKYGEDNFVFEPIVEMKPSEDIWKKEQEIWDQYKDEGHIMYNLRPSGVNAGYEFTDHHRELSAQKLREWNKSQRGKPTWNAGTAYVRTRKCIECGKEFEYTNESRHVRLCSKECKSTVVSRKLKGRKLSEEHKKKLSEAKKKNPSPNMKPGKWPRLKYQFICNEYPEWGILYISEMRIKVKEHTKSKTQAIGIGNTISNNLKYRDLTFEKIKIKKEI